MSIFFSASLYFLSFIPLWVSIIFMDAKSILEGSSDIITEVISIISILLGLATATIIVFTKFGGKKKGQPYTLLEAKKIKTITTEFLLSYILPLFAFDFTCWDGVVLFLIFFFILGYLCVKHKYFSSNLLFEIMDYKFYACTVKNRDGREVETQIISRKELKVQINQEIFLRSINNDYKLHVEKHNN